MKSARLSQVADIDRGCAPSPAPIRNVPMRRPGVKAALPCVGARGKHPPIDVGRRHGA